jgi:hypothetical protein
MVTFATMAFLITCASGCARIYRNDPTTKTLIDEYMNGQPEYRINSWAKAGCILGLKLGTDDHKYYSRGVRYSLPALESKLENCHILLIEPSKRGGVRTLERKYLISWVVYFANVDATVKMSEYWHYNRDCQPANGVIVTIESAGCNTSYMTYNMEASGTWREKMCEMLSKRSDPNDVKDTIWETILKLSDEHGFIFLFDPECIDVNIGMPVGGLDNAYSNADVVTGLLGKCGLEWRLQGGLIYVRKTSASKGQ